MNIGKYIELYTEDLRFKNYSERTIDNYSSQIRNFLNYYSETATKPSEISTLKVKEWIVLSDVINSRKHKFSALKLFYVLTIKQPLKFDKVEYPKSEKKLPQVIDKDFLLDQISKIRNLKHKTIISLAYSTGMRVSEVINLKIEDIDSKRMIINIRNAKGKKDRIVLLTEHILDLLRKYYLEYKPSVYLFNGQNSLQYSKTSCNKIVKKYVGSNYHFHLLRHSSFTAMLEAGTDLRTIQSIAGHSSSKTTEIYTHISLNLLSKVSSPL